MATISFDIADKNLKDIADGLGVGNSGNDAKAITEHFKLLAYNAGVERVRAQEQANLQAAVDAKISKQDVGILAEAEPAVAK